MKKKKEEKNKQTKKQTLDVKLQALVSRLKEKVHDFISTNYVGSYNAQHNV